MSLFRGAQIFSPFAAAISRSAMIRIALAMIALLVVSTVSFSQTDEAAASASWTVDIDAATNTLEYGVGTPVTQVLPAGRYKLTIVDGGPYKAWNAHSALDLRWRTEYSYKSSTLPHTIVEDNGNNFATPAAALAAVSSRVVISLPATETVEFATNDINQGNLGGVRILIEELPQGFMYWADWIASVAVTAPAFQGLATITTPTSVVNVTYDNPLGIHAFDTGSSSYDQWRSWSTLLRDDATSAYTSADVTNIPTDTDIVMLRYAGQQTLTFSEVVANPAFAFLSLNGNGYAFDRDFDILSTGGHDGNTCGIHGCGSSTKLIVEISPGVFEYQLVGTGEPHGTIRFKGSFSTVSWRSLGNEVWNGFNVGIAGVLTEFTDTDGDAVTDDVDNCLNASNADQAEYGW